ncbi:MAG: cell division protein FtsQ, partial [Deltaproteobacteria bacterium]|nr:cell division protein FtsQ [Deltaproteobacteria bacterium]
ITIEERIPAAVIQLDRSYLVDTHGDIFLQADASYGHYPVLTGVAKKDLIHNSAPSARLIKKALTLLDTIRQQRWCAQKDLSVHIDKTFGLTLTLAPHNTKIFLGHDHFADKLPGATKILEDLAQKGALAKTININAINKAYVTLQPGYGV